MDWHESIRYAQSTATELGDPSSSLSQLQALLVKLRDYPRPAKIYVQDLRSPQWQVLRGRLVFESRPVSDAPQRYCGFFGIDIIEAPILAWGDLLPGIYGCEGDFFVIGGEAEGWDDE